MANAAIYLPTTKLAVASCIDGIRTDGGFFRRPTFFDWTIDGEGARLNVMPVGAVGAHLLGFRSYVARLAAPEDRRKKASDLIARTKSVLGLVTATEFGEENSLWRDLIAIAAKHDGFIFAFDSIWMADGSVLLGSFDEEKKA